MATFDRADRDHASCVRLLGEARGARIVPAPVLVEFDHLASRGPDRGAVDALLDEIELGTYVVEDLLASDYPRVRELLGTYADLRVGFVDAAVLAIVERLRAQLDALLASYAFVERMKQVGIEVERRGLDEFLAFAQQERARWAKLIQSLKLQLE